MSLPPWMFFLIAVFVIAFGAMRIKIAITKPSLQDSDRPNYRRGGYYARSGRFHGIIGVTYIILGFYSAAMGLGYQINFVGGCAGQQSIKSSPSSPSNSPGIPVIVQ